ncbi:MAG: hypothetical protein ABFS56_21240 [Pseudomonadota bacterium]
MDEPVCFYSLLHISDGAVSVDYAASDGTATAPDDYTQATGTQYLSLMTVLLKAIATFDNATLARLSL